MRPLAEQTTGELAVRAIHIVIALCLVGVSCRFLFFVSPFNPWGFFIFLGIGLIPLSVAFFGDRKTVYQLLFLGWL
jgi:hypothetical protein